MFLVLLSTKAKKDVKTCESAGFKHKLDKIQKTLKNDPFERSQGFEKLIGNFKDYYSRRINLHNRVVYEVLDNSEKLKDNFGKLYDGIVRIKSAWRHDYTPPSGRLPS